MHQTFPNRLSTQHISPRVVCCAMAAIFVCQSLLHAESPATIVDAAETGNSSHVLELIAAGQNVNAAQADGMTPLHWATYHDQTDLVAHLLSAGAHVNVRNEYGVTPLALAALNGNGNVVEQLLDAGADANTSLPGGETALLTAARTGRLAAVQALIDHGAMINATNAAGQTALMWAAADGNVDVVDLLLKAGADVAVTLPSGFHAFLFAVREGQIDVVKRLLAAGVDVNDSMRPTRSGAKLPRTGTSALILAVENGHFELAVELLKAGADPNDERSGFSPLHTLTWVRKPNKGDGEDGDPAPIGSGQIDSLQFARELVHFGADVNLQLSRGSGGRGKLNNRRATPFLFAADTADLPLMKLLVELGANPFTPNVDGTTPLMAAAGLGTLAPHEEAGNEEESLAAVDYLLKLGADINTVDKNGETAMHGAAYASFPKMVQYLNDHGASIDIWNQKDKYGWTPLLLAEGFRPGNFKPSIETITAIHHVMASHGVTPPPSAGFKANNEDYVK